MLLTIISRFKLTNLLSLWENHIELQHFLLQIPVCMTGTWWIVYSHSKFPVPKINHLVVSSSAIVLSKKFALEPGLQKHTWSQNECSRINLGICGIVFKILWQDKQSIFKWSFGIFNFAAWELNAYETPHRQCSQRADIYPCWNESHALGNEVMPGTNLRHRKWQVPFCQHMSKAAASHMLEDFWSPTF